MCMTISSPAFFNGANIPREYTGEGADVSPPLKWRGLPKGTKELALVCEDCDASLEAAWVHWLVYGISPEISAFPENLPRESVVQVPVSVKQGANSWRTPSNIGYRGPMPPVDHGMHHYRFRLYALASELELSPGADRAALDEAMRGKILAESELVGLYRRTAK